MPNHLFIFRFSFSFKEIRNVSCWNVKMGSKDRGKVFEINRDDSTDVFSSEKGVQGD